MKKLKSKLAIVFISMVMMTSVYADVPYWLKVTAADASGAWAGAEMGLFGGPWGAAAGGVVGGALGSLAAGVIYTDKGVKSLPTRISGALKKSNFDFVGNEHNRLLVNLISQKLKNKKIDLKSAILTSGLNDNYLKIIPIIEKKNFYSLYNKKWIKSFSEEKYIDEIAKKIPDSINRAKFKESFSKIFSKRSPEKFIALLKDYELELKPVDKKNRNDILFRMFLSTLRHSGAYWSQY